MRSPPGLPYLVLVAFAIKLDEELLLFKLEPVSDFFEPSVFLELELLVLLLLLPSFLQPILSTELQLLSDESSSLSTRSNIDESSPLIFPLLPSFVSTSLVSLSSD